MAPNASAQVAPDDADRLNVANILTVARLILVPVFVALLFAGGHKASWQFGALAVFVIAAASDRLDGELARRRGQVTDFGKVADPIADKALTGAALVSLSMLGELAWWMTAVILFRELGITLLRFIVIRHGIIPASPGGKLKTLLQVLALIAYLVPVAPLPFADAWVLGQMWLMIAAVVVTVGTGADYVVRALRLRRGEQAPEPVVR